MVRNVWHSRIIFEKLKNYIMIMKYEINILSFILDILAYLKNFFIRPHFKIMLRFRAFFNNFKLLIALLKLNLIQIKHIQRWIFLLKKGYNLCPICVIRLFWFIRIDLWSIWMRDIKKYLIKLHYSKIVLLFMNFIFLEHIWLFSKPNFPVFFLELEVPKPTYVLICIKNVRNV